MKISGMTDTSRYIYKANHRHYRTKDITNHRHHRTKDINYRHHRTKDTTNHECHHTTGIKIKAQQSIDIKKWKAHKSNERQNEMKWINNFVNNERLYLSLFEDTWIPVFKIFISR